MEGNIDEEQQQSSLLNHEDSPKNLSIGIPLETVRIAYQNEIRNEDVGKMEDGSDTQTKHEPEARKNVPLEDKKVVRMI